MCDEFPRKQHDLVCVCACLHGFLFVIWQASDLALSFPKLIPPILSHSFTAHKTISASTVVYLALSTDKGLLFYNYFLC